MPKDIPVSDRVKKSFSALSSVASVLNASSDKLSKNITELEAELKKLSIGVSSFLVFESREPNNSLLYDDDRLLYCKINGKWGLAIETMEGHEQAPSHKTYECWPFNEAPRSKRVKAVKFIPELLDKLAKDAAAMVADVEQGAEIVGEITRAIASPPPSPPPNLGALAIDASALVAMPIITEEQIATITKVGLDMTKLSSIVPVWLAEGAKKK